MDTAEYQAHDIDQDVSNEHKLSICLRDKPKYETNWLAVETKSIIVETTRSWKTTHTKPKTLRKRKQFHYVKFKCKFKRFAT